MRASILSLLVAGLLAPLTLAAPTERDTVVTPYGLRPASSIVHVPKGGSIEHRGDEIHVLDANGNSVHSSKRDQEAHLPSSRSIAAREEDYGYDAAASWTYSGTPILSSFTATWVVPPLPATNQGQIIFVFNQLGSQYNDVIAGPTLQWGESASGGGDYWTIASWYSTASNNYITSPVTVTPGQVLTGVITQVVNGTGYSFGIEFSNISGTSLPITTTASNLLLQGTIVFEGYGSHVLEDYPSGTTVTEFTSVDVKTATGTPSITWSAASDTGITCAVPTQGATNAAISFTY